MKGMEDVMDLIEEAKVRTIYWAICIFATCYFLSHTSKSMWVNIPISLLVVCALRILSNKVEFHWKVKLVRQQTYLSYLEKKQLSVNDSRLLNSTPPPKWKRKIDSPVVEAAVHEFVNKILKDFVFDLWYSDITPDIEAPELIRALIMDAFGEITGRVKQLNLADLLTRDVVNLIGDHIDLFRRNQLAIGADVLGKLSTEERDERLKHHLMDSTELHPALISPECEYKVLQHFVGGILGAVLRPRESPLVRCIARELVISLVLQPVMNFACPVYINDLIESLFLSFKDASSNEACTEHSVNAVGHQHGCSFVASNSQGNDKMLAKVTNQIEKSADTSHENSIHQPPAGWARVLNAATQRRTEVLMPENLENMWSRGRNYNKEHQSVKLGGQTYITSSSEINGVDRAENFGEELLMNMHGNFTKTDEIDIVRITKSSQDLNSELPCEITTAIGTSPRSTSKLKRSNSTSALKAQLNANTTFSLNSGRPIISEFYSSNANMHVENVKATSDIVLHSETLCASKLKCRVIGAYFEKIASKSFAVYSIVVTDTEGDTWFVKRRYRNFERLHRHLKEIPNYTLHLPPKRIFSSSTDDAFVHQRCIQLDKYLQNLLSISNVAEQHEVLDFLSVSSKNYAFGKSASVMKTLAVNVDDAVDDIVRQFKGVSDGLVRKSVGSSHFEASTISGRNMSWHANNITQHGPMPNTMVTAYSVSDNEEGDKFEGHKLIESGSSAQANGWHSDNELNSKSIPPRVIKHSEVGNIYRKMSHGTDLESELIGLPKYPSASFPANSDQLEDPVGVPPEWTPPNVSVPLLNLVDKLFQLKRRGWLRRQVFWISKQILQVVMEDAIDDFLLRQLSWLRSEIVIAQGIRWVQDILWPNGTFFLTPVKAQGNEYDCQPIQLTHQTTRSHSSIRPASKLGSFEAQLEASRKSSDVKKIIFDGAPTALVSLIGANQYKRTAKDIYYFLQSTICVKQLAYEMLEVVLISVFPELRSLILDVHKRMRVHSV